MLASLRAKLAALAVPTSVAKVEDVQPSAAGFTVVAGEDQILARYVVLATGQGTLKLASLEVETAQARQPFVKVNVVTNNWGATSVPGVWAAGVVAGWPSQAVVCAGSGANVAIEIISALKGEFWVDHDDSTLAPDPA